MEKQRRNHVKNGISMMDEFKLTVASPCSKTWESLDGGDKTRFCSLCEKNVYNLSAMTEEEARCLIEEKEGKLCARFFLKKDGTILTADCPVGRRAWHKKLRRIAMAGIAGVALLTSSVLAIAKPNRDDRTQSGVKPLSIMAFFKTWFDEPESEMLGDVCIPPPALPAVPLLPPVPAPQTPPSEI